MGFSMIRFRKFFHQFRTEIWSPQLDSTFRFFPPWLCCAPAARQSCAARGPRGSEKRCRCRARQPSWGTLGGIEFAISTKGRMSRMSLFGNRGVKCGMWQLPPLHCHCIMSIVAAYDFLILVLSPWSTVCLWIKILYRQFTSQLVVAGRCDCHLPIHIFKHIEW